MFISNPVLLLLIVIIGECYSWGKDLDMTVKIKPGSAECFYETVRAGDELELEYQVVDTQHGNLDIDFYFYGATGNEIKSESRLSASQHKFTLTEAGEYKLCFDNTFSRFAFKTVYFVLLVTNPSAPDDDDWNAENAPWISGEEVYEMKVEDIKFSLDILQSHLKKASFIQDAISAYEARDRNIAENNYTRINTFSLVTVLVMLTTGIIQVILLRSLFDEKSKLYKLWRS